MQRVGFVMRVRAGFEDEYRARHQEVFPDLLSAFTRHGVGNYSIFMHGRTLFAYMTVDGDFDEVMAKLAKEPANVRWQEFMSPLMEPWDGKDVVQIIPEVFFHE